MISETQNQILAILFASGEPIEAERIALAIGMDVDTTIRLLEALKDRLEGEGPFLLLELDGRYQLTTQVKYGGVIRAALEIKRNIPLSQAAMEVLAIIAYNQPVTRAFIEQVRGVDSSGVVNSLVEKGLVEEAGRLELPGRPISYGTTVNFLRCFGLSDLKELPQVAPDDQSESQPLPEDVLEGQIGFEE